ncbi:MAG: DUF559 domain-containing protein [Firmicutes bacterium]|nr:DUF559 domain-containing protein [Bacillota bacterium]
MRDIQKYYELPYNPLLKERARELRKSGTLSEIILWKMLRNRRLNGLDFDRQKIIGNFIIDFYCAQCGVVIEVDGSSHDNKQEYDSERNAFLTGLGLTVLHVTADDVEHNLYAVLGRLRTDPALQT